MKNILDAARVVRSKNAGPFELTMDIIFKEKGYYDTVKKRGLITADVIAGLYKIDPSAVRKIIFFDPANAVKILFKREIVSGSGGDTDVYGAQQHAPLFKLNLDI